jgi:hypothetical protein
MLLVIIGIIGAAMVLETLELAEQNRNFAGTVDRAVGTDLILHIGKVIHETQKERGMTAIHVGSGNTELLFELGRQHVASDEAISGMVDALSRHISQHATHLHGSTGAERVNKNEAAAAEASGSGSGDGSENITATPSQPPGLDRQERRFDNAVRALLAFVAELPKRRQRHIPSSVFTSQDSLLHTTDLPAVDATAAASAHTAGVGCADESDCVSGLAQEREMHSAIAFYTQMHNSFIDTATEMCTDFMTGVVPGATNQLAPALFAYINLMVLKEKAGIERAIVSGQIALHDFVTSTQAGAEARQKQGNQFFAEKDNPFSQGFPLATMVELREVVAQQEGYRTGAKNGILFGVFPMFVPSLSWQNYRFNI